MGRGEDEYMDIWRTLYQETHNRGVFYVQEGIFANIKSALKRIYPTPTTCVDSNYWMRIPSVVEAMANEHQYFSFP